MSVHCGQSFGCKDENVLEIGGGDSWAQQCGCTGFHCTADLKNGQDGTFYVMCVLSQFEKSAGHFIQDLRKQKPKKVVWLDCCLGWKCP